MRLPYNATTESEVIQYIRTRSFHLAENGVSWDNILHKTPYGYYVEFVLNNKTYYSCYITERGKGYANILMNMVGDIITVGDCNIVSYLEHIGKNHIVMTGTYDTAAYKAISSHYGDKRAMRSNVFLMNHIDEGIIILNKIGSSQSTKNAFCLHPLLQDDVSVSANYSNLCQTMSAYDISLAMEYRSIANAYLSQRNINSLNDIKLSPLDEVNELLIADKVQNYKDFLLYHYGTHARSNELNQYFNNWIDKLQCRDIFDWYIEYSKTFDANITVV